ncbi:MAG: YhbY family RNA-binding protein [Verrucomicrobiae bacterium]|nr:YhbY family RNA-binding protein [Verrucomicrobiae bacterium]
MASPLNNAQKRTLKALAQHLEPVVTLGKLGMTPAFLKMLETELDKRELIKVRLDGFKSERKTLAPILAEKGGAELIQLVGHVVVLYRRQPDAAKRKVVV